MRIIWEAKNNMAELKESLKKSLGELRKEKERKFDQTVDLIINLQKINFYYIN